MSTDTSADTASSRAADPRRWLALAVIAAIESPVKSDRKIKHPWANLAVKCGTHGGTKPGR